MSTSCVANLDYRNYGRKALGRRLIEMECINQRLLVDLEKLRLAVRERDMRFEKLDALYRVVVRQLNTVPRSVREEPPALAQEVS